MRSIALFFFFLFSFSVFGQGTLEYQGSDTVTGRGVFRNSVTGELMTLAEPEPRRVVAPVIVHEHVTVIQQAPSFRRYYPSRAEAYYHQRRGPNVVPNIGGYYPSCGGGRSQPASSGFFFYYEKRRR